MSSLSSADGVGGAALDGRYNLSDPDADSDADATGILANLSVNVTPSTANNAAGRKSYHAGPSKRSGRHSVANDNTGPMTLREQEQVSRSTGGESGCVHYRDENCGVHQLCAMSQEIQ